MAFRPHDVPRRFLLHRPVEPPADLAADPAGGHPQAGHDPDDADLYGPEVVAWGMELPWGEAVMLWPGSDETSHVLQTSNVARTAARFGRHLGTSVTWLDTDADDELPAARPGPAASPA